MTDLAKRAADMLLQGATLLAEPCPYCKGVRVLKDGSALCTGCGREPRPQDVPAKDAPGQQAGYLDTLEKKLESLSAGLAKEADPARQQELLKSIGMLADAISKLKAGS